jgi:hypothetical protein
MQVAAARTALFPNCGWIIRCEILEFPGKIAEHACQVLRSLSDRLFFIPRLPVQRTPVLTD